MGATASVPFGDAASSAVLQRLGGSNEIPSHDPSWIKLLSEAPLARADARLVEQKLVPALKGLLEHNSATSNFQVLLTVTISLLNEVRVKVAAAPPAASATTLLSAANALHLLGLAVKTAAQQCYGPKELAVLFEVPEALPVPQVLVQQGQSQLMKVLVRRVIAIIIQTPVSDPSYLLLFDAMLLLLHMASPALHQPTARAPAGAQPLLDCIHSQRQLAAPLVQKLLQVFLQQPLPSSTERPWRDPALLQAAAAQSTASYLWAPFSTSSSSSQSAGYQLAPRAGPSPLGDLALQLLLLLIYAPDDPPSSCNPYRRSLATFQDEAAVDSFRGSEDGAAPLSPSNSATTLSPRPSISLPTHLAAQYYTNGHTDTSTASTTTLATAAVHSTPFRPLHDALSSWSLSSDPELSVLLLYSLLHGCPAFRNHALGRTDVETLLLPLLRQLYTCPASASSHAYLLQVLLLLLSQDTSLMQAIQHTPVAPAQLSWYTDHTFTGTAGTAPGGQVSLGSVVVMVLVKALMSGFGASSFQGNRSASTSAAGDAAGRKEEELAAATLAPLGSDPLPTNALAALANLAPSVVNLHQHAAQRLVSLFKVLGKRHARLLQLVPPSPRGLQGQRALTREASGQQPTAGPSSAQQGQHIGTQPTSPTGAVAAGRQESAQLQRKLSGPSPLHARQPPSPSGATSRSSLPPELASQLSVVADFLQVVLEVLLMPLDAAGGAQRNPELLYALLQHQECFLPFVGHPRLMDHMRGLQELLSFFNKHLEEAQIASSGSGVEWGVSRVMQVLTAAALYWRPVARGSHQQATRFVYEEEGHPEDFFVPYLWALLVPRLPSCWDTSVFKLLPAQ